MAYSSSLFACGFILLLISISIPVLAVFYFETCSALLLDLCHFSSLIEMIWGCTSNIERIVQ
ncbi:unnamed protein product [Larinioides sclopetarius]|uniref:Uncharacterized protein n=1 Tax=Larinioides sclopetarius TaxID=280406 RepID=A0AAV1ZLT0_9ARAC